nr:F-box/LRR-repeat protein 17 [Odocoileus virginianus texanus]
MGLLLSKEPCRRPLQKRPRCGSWWRRRRRPHLRWPRGAPAKAAAAPRGRDCLFRGPCMLCLVVHGPGAPAPAGPEEEPPLSSPRPLRAYGAAASSQAPARRRAGLYLHMLCTVPELYIHNISPNTSVDAVKEILLTSLHKKKPMYQRLVPTVIFSNLSLDERCLSASLVCKYWRDLCLDFQFWKQLDLSSHQQVTDELLEKIASRSQNIIEINISDCRSMSDTGVCVLAFKYPGLLRYTAYRCKQLSDTSIIAVASHCPLLQKVHVGNQDKLTDEGLKQELP